MPKVENVEKINGFITGSTDNFHLQGILIVEDSYKNNYVGVACRT
jgi:hypothetical protein